MLIQDVYYANLSIRMMKQILFAFSCAFVEYDSVQYWNITFSFAISIILCLGFWKIFCWCHILNSTIYQCTLLIREKLLTKLIPINYNYTIFTQYCVDELLTVTRWIIIHNLYMVLILLLSHIAGDISYLLQYILSWKPGIFSKLNIKVINLLIRVTWIEQWTKLLAHDLV